MEVVASLSQGRTAAAQCGLLTHKSVPVIFEPPCILSFLACLVLPNFSTLSHKQNDFQKKVNTYNENHDKKKLNISSQLYMIQRHSLLYPNRNSFTVLPTYNYSKSSLYFYNLNF